MRCHEYVQPAHLRQGGAEDGHARFFFTDRRQRARAIGACIDNADVRGGFEEIANASEDKGMIVGDDDVDAGHPQYPKPGGTHAAQCPRLQT